MTSAPPDGGGSPGPGASAGVESRPPEAGAEAETRGAEGPGSPLLGGNVGDHRPSCHSGLLTSLSKFLPKFFKLFL